jgi:hypothetical protein
MSDSAALGAPPGGATGTKPKWKSRYQKKHLPDGSPNPQFKSYKEKAPRRGVGPIPVAEKRELQQGLAYLLSMANEVGASLSKEWKAKHYEIAVPQASVLARAYGNLLMQNETVVKWLSQVGSKAAYLDVVKVTILCAIPHLAVAGILPKGILDAYIGSDAVADAVSPGTGPAPESSRDDGQRQEYPSEGPFDFSAVSGGAQEQTRPDPVSSPEDHENGPPNGPHRIFKHRSRTPDEASAAGVLERSGEGI